MTLVQFQFDRVAAQVKASGLGAILIAPSEDLVCLMGHKPLMCERFQGLFITAEGDYFYICNLLYADEIAQHLPAERIFSWFDGDGFVPTVREVLAQRGLLGQRIGVNSAVRAFNTLAIAAEVDVQWVDAMALVNESRIHKTPAELDGLRGAARVADAAFLKTVEEMHTGMREAQVIKLLVDNMNALGGDARGALVASGPNGALPHYLGSGRVIQKGDAVVMDFGCFYQSMRSDTTRTVFMGPVTEKQKEVYSLVLQANLAGEKAAVEGAWIPDVDKAARDVIEAAGYGPYFTTRLGHGIGYFEHEAPDIKQTNARRLERGMAFSIEPGIYLPNEFGVRIEDIVCIDETGKTQVLNTTSKEMLVLD